MTKFITLNYIYNLSKKPATFNRTNEHLYSEIQNNTLLLDRGLVFPYNDINRLTPGVPTAENWSSMSYDRMHIRSGLRGQDIECNALLSTGSLSTTWAGKGFGFMVGGTMLYSYCPNELAPGINNSCSTYVETVINNNIPTPVYLSSCTQAEINMGLNTTPLHLKENLYVNAEYLSVLHHASSQGNIEKNIIAGSPMPAVPSGNITLAAYQQNLPVVNHCAQSLLTSPWFGNTVVKNLDCATGVGEIQAPIIGVLPSPGYTWSIQPSATAGLVPGSSSTFSVTAAGTYTVTVSGGGQSTVSTFRVFAPAQAHCQTCPPVGEQLVNQAGMWLYDQALATDLITDNGSNPVLSHRKLFITGQLTINTDLTLNHCTVWFGPGASVVLGPGSSFAVVNESVLQAACDWWGGIVAMNDAQQKLSIEQNCLVQQMETGILISNNAGIRVTNSTLKNNINGSIFFLDFDNTNPFTWIKSSVFTGDAVIKPFRGIFIQNCSHLNIGDANNTELGNLFKDMQNGVEIRGNGSIGSVIANNTNQIGLFNNTFKNIHVTSVPPTYNLIMQDIYGAAKGCAVHIDYNSAPTFNANTTVSYTGLNTSAEVRMENCDKGIISKNNNLTAEKLYLKDCNYGIMNYNLFTKEVTVKRNKIENAHIGTQVAGNYTNYMVQGNDIKLTEGILASNIGYGLMALTYPAIGIDIKQNNPPYNANEQFVVDDNTIRIPYYAGKGIANLGANASQEIKNNKIYFTVANGTPQPGAAYIDPGLYGVLNTNTNGIKLRNNLVDGQYSLALYNLSFSHGYYFETSKDMVITCNKARATKQGLYAWGDNETDDINIKFNKFRFNRNPLFTLDNGANQTGTFGDIGDGLDDNGNDWVNGMNTGQQISWLQNGVFRVWRQGSSQFQNTIYTDASLLTFSQSGSLNPPFADYGVGNNVSPVADPCPDPAFSNTTEPSNTIVWSNMDVAVAEYLAQQQQTYIAYADVGEWWNFRNLYERLSYDSTLLNSSAILQSFYANYANSTIHELVAAGMGMQALFDFSGDSIALDALYTDALNQNYAATGTTDAELYEQSINEMMLRTSRYGIDSVSEVQKTELAFVAHLCPFAAGPAVYKARTLYALLDPMAQYYDRLMCVQNMGQNKNGNIDYVNLDSLYEAEGDKLGALLLANNGQNTITESILKEDRLNNIFDDIVKVYPNPATTTVIIAYRKEVDGVFTLYNVLGERILQSTLSNLNSKAQIPIQDIANGVYQYEIQFGTESRIKGKLNIIK
jgi:hypothetical protein